MTQRGKKGNNQIEPTTAVVGTVGVVMGGGVARAKGKMSGWRTMQGNRAAEEATEGRRRLWNKREGRTMQGDQAVHDMKRGEGRTPRTQQSGKQHGK